jgi:hypothetical protein
MIMIMIVIMIIIIMVSYELGRLKYICLDLKDDAGFSIFVVAPQMPASSKRRLESQ